MTQLMNEKTVPVQGKWLIKPIISSIPFLLILAFFLYMQMDSAVFEYAFIGFVCVGLGVQELFQYLRRSNFSFTLEQEYLRVRQGVLSKQERTIPYSVIQEVTVQNGLLDRLLGLASVSVFNASQSGYSTDAYGHNTRLIFGIPVHFGKGKSQLEMIGFSGNMVHIPGLLPEDAERLKTALLQKMKEFKGKDTGSGL
ncbi:MAG: PH domain-containing protein [Candidatus Peregrinibacteria bacterium]